MDKVAKLCIKAEFGRRQKADKFQPKQIDLLPYASNFVRACYLLCVSSNVWKWTLNTTSAFEILYYLVYWCIKYQFNWTLICYFILCAYRIPDLIAWCLHTHERSIHQLWRNPFDELLQSAAILNLNLYVSDTSRYMYLIKYRIRIHTHLHGLCSICKDGWM